MKNNKICLVNVKGKFITVKPGINIYDIIITLPIREFKLHVSGNGRFERFRFIFSFLCRKNNHALQFQNSKFVYSLLPVP